MKFEKLKSGSYRIRKQFDGVKYSITVDHKPTQKEAIKLLQEEIEKHNNFKDKKTGNGGTFEEFAKDYISIKEMVLSPSTIIGYNTNLKQISKDFKSSKMSDITQADVQREINNLTKKLSPKTVKNVHGLISSVFHMYEPEFVLYTTLPKKTDDDAYIPSTDDVKALIRESKGTRYEIPIRLACYGLRRSEICALTIFDLDGNELRINKATVLDKNKNWVTKSTKTLASNRIITIDEELANLIAKQGYIYRGHPNSITRYISETLDRLGIPHFSLHKLRHYFASSLSGEIPDADIMAFGGWKTDYVMKTVYRHSMNARTAEGRKKISETLTKKIASV